MDQNLRYVDEKVALPSVVNQAQFDPRSPEFSSGSTLCVQTRYVKYDAMIDMLQRTGRERFKSAF